MKRFQYALLAFLVFGLGTANAQIYRAVWVTRWDYRTAQEVSQIMANLASLHANVVLFQVRGNGTVFYPSSLEPWAEELGGENPGWNPLATAIREAHSHGLKLFAWLNVFPGWRGVQPPENPFQLYNRHRDWFLADEDGTLLPLNSHYVWLNPVLPAVQDYLFTLVQELAGTPGLDGLHFDYFRFPGPGVSYDSTSLALFRKHYHMSVWDSTVLWDQFRRESITSWLGRTYRSVKHLNPDLVVSAAVIGDYDNGPNIFFQEAHRWLAEGIMDMVFPMTYTDDPALFQRWLKRHKPFAHGRAICPGLMIYSDSTTVLRELNAVRQMGFPGLALFAYSSLFPNHVAGELAARLAEQFKKEPVGEAAKPAGPAAGFFRKTLVLPPAPRAGDSLRIAAQLGGIPSQPESLQCLAVWQADGLFPVPRLFPLHPTDRDSTVWYSTDALLFNRPTDQLLMRLILFRSGKLQQTAVQSEPLQVVVDVPGDRYKQANGRFGPLMTGVSRAAVDATNRLWCWEPGKGLHVLVQDGTEAPFSPLTTYTDPSGKRVPLTGVFSLHTGRDGHILIACRKNGGTLLLRSTQQCQLHYLRHIPVDALDVAFDRVGQIYLLYRDGWSIADSTGNILWRFRFKQRHTPNTIAVSPDGRWVLVACRTEGSVHRWERVAEHPAFFLQEDDLPTGNVGLGGVHWSPGGTITISHVPGGYVSVLDSTFQLIDYLRGGRPALRAPRLAVCGPADSLIFILETGGTTPVRAQKWRRMVP